MAEFNFPANRKEVVERVLSDMILSFSSMTPNPNAQPFLPRSWLRAIGTAVGGRSFDLYDIAREVIKQMFPQTATGVWLEMHGALKDVFKKAATTADGFIVIVGSTGIVIAASTPLSIQGRQYTLINAVETDTVTNNISSLTRVGSVVTAVTAGNHNLATGQAVTIAGADQTDYNGSKVITVLDETSFTYSIATTPATPATGTITAAYVGALAQVVSQDTGEIQNLSDGNILTFVTPIAGIGNNATVNVEGIGGGADIEDQEVYRGRVLFRYQNPISTYSKSEIEAIALSVPGVTRVWVIPATTDTAGTVTVYFVRDNQDPIIPTPEEVDQVKDALLEHAPAIMEEDDTIVDAPTPVSVAFVFSALTPDTPTMRVEIDARLQLFFHSYQVNLATDITEEEYRTTIKNTIDPASGIQLQSFTLSSPTGTISIGDDEIPVYGGVTWP